MQLHTTTFFVGGAYSEESMATADTHSKIFVVHQCITQDCLCSIRQVSWGLTPTIWLDNADGQTDGDRQTD